MYRMSENAPEAALIIVVCLVIAMMAGAVFLML